MYDANGEAARTRQGESIDLRGLIALRQCLASGSVSAAAKVLGWSHPTVDHHLAKLERRLGAQLLERSPRGSRATEAGSLVAERAGEILGLCDRLTAEVRDAQSSASPVVRFAALPTIAARILPSLQRALRRLPDPPRLDVTVDELLPIITALEQGRTDVAIIVATGRLPPISNPRISLHRLSSEPLHLCVASDHPLALASPRKAPSLELLRDAEWALGAEEHDPGDAGLKEIFAAAGLKPRVGMRLDDYRAIQRLVGAGLVVALVPQSAIDADASMHSWVLPKTLLRRDLLLAVRAPERGGSRAPGPAQGRRLLALERVIAEIRAAATDM